MGSQSECAHDWSVLHVAQIRMRSKESDQKKAVKLLERDLINGPLHCFGQHNFVPLLERKPSLLYLIRALLHPS